MLYRITRSGQRSHSAARRSQFAACAPKPISRSRALAALAAARLSVRKPPVQQVRTLTSLLSVESPRASEATPCSQRPEPHGAQHHTRRRFGNERVQELPPAVVVVGQWREVAELPA